MCSGPVHTLQQEITPEILATVQHEYEIQDQERKLSHAGHNRLHLPHRRSHVDHGQ